MSATLPPPPPRSATVVVEKFLIGALAALVVARPLILGDDPGRLRLTSAAGPIWFDLAVWTLLSAYAAWRVITPRRHRLSPGLLLLLPMGLLLLPPASGAYMHADRWVRWEWLTLAPVFFLTRQLCVRPEDQRGLLNMILASALSIAAIGIIQGIGPLVGLPSTEIVLTDVHPGLAGDDEFQGRLNASVHSVGVVHGTLESPDNYIFFLFSSMFIFFRFSDQCSFRTRLVVVSVLTLAVVVAINHTPGQVWPLVSFSEGWRVFRTIGGFSGAGGANFSRVAEGENVASGSAMLSLTATLGIAVAVAWVMVSSLAVYYGLMSLAPKTRLPDDAEHNTARGTRWEFYIGGIVGLLGGFVAMVGQMPAEAPVWEVNKVGGFAVIRGIVWLAAFGILEKTRISPARLRSGTSLGVLFTLVFGLQTEAMQSTTLLFLVTVLTAILMIRPDEGEQATGENPWSRPLAVLALVVSVSILAYFFVTQAAPGLQTVSAVRQARMASRLYPHMELDIELANSKVEQATARVRTAGFLTNRIITPLKNASDRDPGNAALLLEVARWERALWRQLLHIDPGEAARLGKEILKSASKAATLDARNVAGEQAILEALFLYRRESNSKPAERLEAFNNHLARIVERQPELEVPYRYRMVTILLDAGDSDGVEREIATLLRLNRDWESPHGMLSETQRQDVIERAKKMIKNPPKELLDEWTR